MRMVIVFILLISILFITSCSRDMSKQITDKEAEEIAFKELSSGTNITPEDKVWKGTTHYINGDYGVDYKDLNNPRCTYFIMVKYDGSKILENKHICLE